MAAKRLVIGSAVRIRNGLYPLCEPSEEHVPDDGLAFSRDHDDDRVFPCALAGYAIDIAALAETGASDPGDCFGTRIRYRAIADRTDDPPGSADFAREDTADVFHDEYRHDKPPRW